MKTHRRALAVLGLIGLLSGLTGSLVGCATPNPELRSQAASALRRGELDLAQRKLTTALKQDATDWRAMGMRARVELERDNPLQAQLLVEKALSLRPRDERAPELYDLLAEALFRSEQDQRLYDMLEQRTSKSGRVEDYLRQGRFLYRLGDADAALVAYRTAVRVSGGQSAAPYLALADFYENVGDSGQAVAALRRAHGIEPANPIIARRLRQHGVVPGPTVVLPPED